MTPPETYTKEELREMDHEELVEYAYDKQEAAYRGWERNMGDDL